MRGEKRPVGWRVRTLLLPLVLAGCASKLAQQVPLADVPPALQGTAPEQAVTLLPLGGPLQSENAELSGLAWYGEHLVMLPQYPGWRSDSAPCLYTVSKADVLVRLENTASGPLEPRCIPFDSGGASRSASLASKAMRPSGSLGTRRICPWRPARARERASW